MRAEPEFRAVTLTLMCHLQTDQDDLIFPWNKSEKSEPMSQSLSFISRFKVFWIVAEHWRVVSQLL